MRSTEDPVITIVKGAVTIGALVRARRKAAGLTQAQAAGLAGVGNRFLSELERGKKTLEFDRVLQVLGRLGFELAAAPRGARLFAAAAGAPPACSPPVGEEAAPVTEPRALEPDAGPSGVRKSLKKPHGRGTKRPMRGRRG